MLLALDLGNTSLSAAVFDAGRIVRRFRIPVAGFNRIVALLTAELASFPPGQIKRAGLASVNPPATRVVEEALHKVLPDVELAVIGRDVKAPVPALIDHPEKVGTDLLLAALAAFRRVNDSCIVVQCGTAMTLNVVSAKGELLGGVIAPGLAMSTTPSMPAPRCCRGLYRGPSVTSPARTPMIASGSDSSGGPSVRSTDSSRDSALSTPGSGKSSPPAATRNCSRRAAKASTRSSRVSSSKGSPGRSKGHPQSER